MKQIEVYDLDFENITNICEDNNVDEWEVIEAMFDAIRDKKIDITEWLQEAKKWIMILSGAKKKKQNLKNLTKYSIYRR